MAVDIFSSEKSDCITVKSFVWCLINRKLPSSSCLLLCYFNGWLKFCWICYIIMKDGFNRCQSKNLFSTPSTQTSITSHLKPLNFKDRKKDVSHSLFTKCTNWHNYLSISFYFQPLNIFQMHQDWKYLSHRESFYGVELFPMIKPWNSGEEKEWFYMEPLNINFENNWDRFWSKVNKIPHGGDFLDTSKVLSVDLGGGSIGVYSYSLNYLSSRYALIHVIKSWPSISTGFTSTDSINCWSTILGEKIPKTSKTQKLILPCTTYYTESTTMKWC